MFTSRLVNIHPSWKRARGRLRQWDLSLGRVFWWLPHLKKHNGYVNRCLKTVMHVIYGYVYVSEQILRLTPNTRRSFQRRVFVDVCAQIEECSTRSVSEREMPSTMVSRQSSPSSRLKEVSRGIWLVGIWLVNQTTPSFHWDEAQPIYRNFLSLANYCCASRPLVVTDH